MTHFILIVLVLFASTPESFARKRSFQTARLKSTAGAGVGAVLLEEAAVLNPASAAFFTLTTLHLQASKGDLTNAQQQSRPTRVDTGVKERSVIISDTTGNLKGTFGYHTLQELNYDRERYSLSLAGPMGPKGTFGVLNTYTKDSTNLSNGEVGKNRYFQIGVGANYVISEEITLGAVVHDIRQRNVEENILRFGGQYVFKEMVFIMADIFGPLGYSFEDGAGYALGAQIRFLDDFYLRAGLNRDKFHGTKTVAWGGSWIGPKLSIHFSYRVERPDGKSILLYTDEELKESTLAMALRF